MPFEKMDRALESVLRLFTRALENAGQDCGALALRGSVPSEVASLLADSIVYPEKNGPEFLTLGVTKDFKGFSYQPHCRLFLIINGARMLEDIEDTELRTKVVISQIPRPYIDAHMMKIWIKYIRPAGNARANNDEAELTTIIRSLVAETMNIKRLAPKWISQHINIEECSREWSSGFPGTIGRLLTPDVRRMNSLPMTEFVENVITDFLAAVQMRGIREQHVG